STLNRDHRAAPSTDQESHRAETEVTAVLRIEGNRIRAAQLVAKVLLGDRHAKPSLAEPALHFRLHLTREIDFRESHVSVVVALDFLQQGQIRRVELVDERFGAS